MGDQDPRFNVEQGERRSYRLFIEGLRERCRDPRRYSHGRPVLPVEENPPTRWFTIILETNTHQITLRIRGDNLYLVAYQMENSDQWLEIRRTTPQLIPGSEPLNFNFDYAEMVGSHGMGNVNLGRRQLVDAVNTLATTSSSDPDAETTRKRRVAVLCLMICESIRFCKITIFLTDNFGTVLSIPTWLQYLIKEWSSLSEELLHVDAHPHHRFQIPPRNKVKDVQSASEASDIIGILKGYHFDPEMLRVKRETSEQHCHHGRQLVEVFAVRMNTFEGQLYGTISVTDAFSTQYIYNRERDESESIKPGDTALLTGPPHCIYAYDNFTIEVDLKDNNRSPPDDQVSSGQFTWNVYNIANKFDTLLATDFQGKHGAITVSYVVMSNAVEATVEVTLINGDGEDPANVYGLLQVGSGRGYSYWTVLFQKERGDAIDVRPGNLIPLSKSVVVVPLDSSLEISAHLTDRDRISDDDEIANGTADFPAQVFGTSEKNISGKYGEIRVKVIWNIQYEP